MITIHPSKGQTMSSLTHALVQLNGGNAGTVRSGHGGVIVDERLAYSYLAYVLTRGAAAAARPVTSPVPAGLATVVRQAEHARGMDKPLAGKSSGAAVKPQRSAPKALAAAAKAPATTKEQRHV